MDLDSRSDPSLLGATHLQGVDNVDRNHRHTYHEISAVQPETMKRRMAHRKLRSIHIFMITINATLGTGLYWRGGQVLEVGGSLAVILSFLLLGILAWVVMQCIAELLCIWPVPGALAVFVRNYVDDELGIVVGIAYWFTYSVSYAYLISATASEVHYWMNPANSEFDGTVLYLIIPLILILINSFGVELYGWFEVATGVVKISCLFIIIISMIVFAARDTHALENWKTPTRFDQCAAKNWVSALFMCLSIATFSYVGVEIPAAIALEARPPKRKSTATESSEPLDDTGNIGDTIRFSVKWVTLFACIAYTLSGLLLSLHVVSTNPDLPRVGWVDQTSTVTTSAFVIAAELSRAPGVASAFNGFLVFTALSCANTNLFIASRMLFGLINQIEGGPDEPWYLNVLAWLGRTNSYRVPIRAMAVSALSFIWLPFLQLANDATESNGNTKRVATKDCHNGGPTSGIKSFIDVLADMASVGVLVVWACECWAFIRYYNCINRHKVELMERRVPRVRRFDEGDNNDYPYISNGQPFTAYFGLFACLFLLLVVNGASLWNGFYVEPFLSSYLIVLLFILLWIILKFFRGARWSLVDLSNPDTVESIIRGLHQLSFAGYPNESTSNTEKSSSMWPLSLLAKSPRET
ncbi:amino acid permease-domain-containing protein [Annulohypoxylon maeteangense]|uniref:amino acid permease-domain-containing protein n=1 Tax=Annulohypoxylon maeteangense TaxID=1927788 RepID=UPI0020076D30|nr:amino acid permease-domain-containing protein [Annulohypoxylon maeteangense]KAI0889171.1 amino acid permease-domain-containing protein [Annulohypoxylon maeteangense]